MCHFVPLFKIKLCVLELLTPSLFPGLKGDHGDDTEEEEAQNGRNLDCRILSWS
jgi:hypothetical protein